MTAPEIWVPVAVALITGAAIPKIFEIVKEWRRGIAADRRTEVDRITGLLADAEAAKRIAERRERIATEWGHKNAVIAIRAGVPEADLPVLDFKDG